MFTCITAQLFISYYKTAGFSCGMLNLHRFFSTEPKSIKSTKDKYQHHLDACLHPDKSQSESKGRLQLVCKGNRGAAGIRVDMMCLALVTVVGIYFDAAVLSVHIAAEYVLCL